MRFVKIMIVSLTLAFLLASVAMAVPSFRGYTGLVVIPTADVLDQGEYSVGVMTEEADDFEANDVFAMYSPTNNFEIGINSIQLVNASERETQINAKYRLMAETEQRAAVAFGLIDASDEIESTAYAVFSKSLMRGIKVFDNDITNLRGHIGIGGGQLDGLFFGVSLFAGNRVMFSYEWDSRDSNIGFRLTPVRGLRLHAAWFDVGGRDDLGFGVSFTKNY